jgi:hypothetical protein
MHFLPDNMKAIVKAVQEYMQGIMAGDLSSCELPTPQAVTAMVLNSAAFCEEDGAEALQLGKGGGGGSSSKVKKTPYRVANPKVKAKVAPLKSSAPMVLSSASKRQAKTIGSDRDSSDPEGKTGQKRRVGGDGIPGSQPEVRRPRLMNEERSEHYYRLEGEIAGRDDEIDAPRNEDEPPHNLWSCDARSGGPGEGYFVPPAFGSTDGEDFEGEDLEVEDLFEGQQ